CPIDSRSDSFRIQEGDSSQESIRLCRAAHLAASERVWMMLGEKKRLSQLSWDALLKERIRPGQKILSPQILFEKVEDAAIEEEMTKLSGLTQKKSCIYAPLKEEISFDTVQSLDLRVAQILTVERIPKSKKLLKIAVDLGFEKRVIVAGIGEKIEDLSSLLGKKIIVAANLKSATLMGVESRGMLFAASLPDGLEVPFLQDAEPGAVVR
ncbi:MAG TPA: hypothetical protein DHV52_00865, partial [Parachlamydiales bacterium]|nr:hypothetical protein [Parachlamydiales bacterium]